VSVRVTDYTNWPVKIQANHYILIRLSEYFSSKLPVVFECPWVSRNIFTIKPAKETSEHVSHTPPGPDLEVYVTHVPKLQSIIIRLNIIIYSIHTTVVPITEYLDPFVAHRSTSPTTSMVSPVQLPLMR